MIGLVLATRVARLTTLSRFTYHIDDLMKRTYRDSSSLLYLPANHLYIDKALNQVFNEKMVVRLMIEQIKTSQTQFEVLIKYTEQNIDNINSFKTISTILVTCFQMNYFSDPSFCQKLAHRGFYLLKSKQKSRLESFSYSICRFIIGISRLVGLKKFSNEDFQSIQVAKIKPLFLVFILQLFWQEGLGLSYQLPNKIMEHLQKIRQIIPFSDYHHINYAKRTIRDPRFFKIIDELYIKIREKENRQSTANRSSNIQVQVVEKMYNQYLSDLQKKFI